MKHQQVAAIVKEQIEISELFIVLLTEVDQTEWTFIPFIVASCVFDLL